MTERVDAVVEHRPAACRQCGHGLTGAAVVGEPTRHQVIELPPVRAHVTEHQALTLAPRWTPQIRPLMDTAKPATTPAS